jgi:hypothetical protein
MVIWTAAEPDRSEAPTFSLTGMLVAWPDGAPAFVKQTPFTWRRGAWLAAVEVSRPVADAPSVHGTIRLEPAVAATWRRRRLNPRREAATQLCSALQLGERQADLGVVTFSAI